MHYHDNRKGFTLLELLIVVAIVAVLSGFLLPVFARAQIAAKRAVSASNLKQITLGSLLYADDHDDGLPIFANGNALLVGSKEARVDTWVWTTQPYIKNLQIMIDPAMGDPYGFYGSGSNATHWNQNAFPDYGVNYVFLAPWLYNPVEGACSKSGSVMASGASQPAATVFYTETYRPNLNERMYPVGGYSDLGSWIVTAPGMLSILSGSDQYCIWQGMDWSKKPGDFNDGEPFTAEAFHRYGKGGNVAFLDGHVKWLSRDQQAAGTDWATSAYMQTRIIDSGRYLWDFDETFFGAQVP